MKDLVLELLKYGSLMFEIDPRKVPCPKHLADQKTVWLQFGYNMAKPIRDLEVTDAGISGTLTFGGLNYWCCVLWSDVIKVAAGSDNTYWSSTAHQAAPRERAAARGLRVIEGGRK